jgi:hypothetical protein
VTFDWLLLLVLVLVVLLLLYPAQVLLLCPQFPAEPPQPALIR